MDYLSLVWNFFKLRSNLKKSKEEIKIIQEEKLRNILKYAYDNSSYYREEFEKAGITNENISWIPISHFPTMDKAILMEHFNELVTVPDLRQEELRIFDKEETEQQKKFKDKYHVVHSSGSTGKPGYFVYDDKAWNEMLLSIIRGALWDMTTPEIIKLLVQGPRIVYIAATDGRYGGAMAVGGGIEGLHAKQLFLDIKTPLSEWIEKVNNFKPNMIIGYPSAIKILGDIVEKGGIEVDVIRVVSCGEPLGPSLRKFMEKTFSADVINFYGASESLALGVETGNSQGMYLFNDMNYIEVVNGKMYITSLYNRVQPLIRYGISDHLILKKADNLYPFTKAEILLGRNEDLLWFEDEDGNRDFLHPLAIEGFCIDGLRDFQFMQTSKESFEMFIEVSEESLKDSIEAEMLRQMKGILREKQLDYVQFYIRFVENILPDSKTGKKKLVVNG